MSPLDFEDIVDGIDGITLNNLSIGGTTHAVVGAVGKEPSVDENSPIPQEFHYELLTDISKAVAVGASVTIPDEPDDFVGTVTRIDPYPLGRLNFLTVRRVKP